MSLTTANAIIMLSVPGLFDSPTQIQGFSADDIFDVDQVKMVETMMGVDGILSGGYVINEKVLNITLQSDSPSIFFFDNWAQAQSGAIDTFVGSGLITLLGIQTKFTLTKGFLSDAPPMPSAGKTLKPRKYTIRWQDITPAPA